ncbi:preprotein translocase subunit YajC [Blastococcus tunisiensis]|uniref:Preprotein translocase subunit YajC n=1 Tax=Blastococcus tunisiensis TaxID=1798228 RepID=A0A1I2HHB6_9ACTN|nr:preprotein translocase subunit YajC [Blastococcus sp. DSM 46838]SFF29675.1 preprotein translocase subunit YajC [Blastococcus sp. DSM 46838]
MEQYFPILMLALLALVLFVLPARQRKRMQAQQQEMQNSLTVGTPVMTTAGMHGTVAGLAEKTVDLEIAPGVVVTMARPAIMEIRRPLGAVDGDGTDSGSSGTTGGRPADGTV